MTTQNIDTISAYLKIGSASIRLHFPDTSFKAKAFKHIFLSEQTADPIASDISYIRDDNVDDLLDKKGPANVVRISKTVMAGNHTQIILGMFDEFTVALDFKDRNVRVRYPSSAPVRTLLDDVLQAALQPVLDRNYGFVLHGSCMVKNRQAIVFMGDSGSGKSTTAFNLRRFGFHCYADDAVIVTQTDNALHVSPLARELSLRPLAFKLLQNQKVHPGAYVKDGQKYYFGQDVENPPEALLKHICFLELNGRAETETVALDQEAVLLELKKNTRHFSFMGRHAADKYARILSSKTPHVLTARVGTDLDYQGSVFESLSQTESPSPNKIETAVNHTADRKEKADRIRHAWQAPVHKSLVDVIPLLGDFDPYIFRLALSFFQTFPTAKLSPIDGDKNTFEITSTLYQASWPLTDAWIEGCETLLRQTGPEVFQRFAFSWITSAPLLYPFLSALTPKHSKLRETVDAAWLRHSSLSEQNHSEGSPCLRIDSGDPPDWGQILIQQNRSGNHKTVYLFPSFSGKRDAGRFVAFLRTCRQQGLNAVACRDLPLCCLTEEDATYLLSNKAWCVWNPVSVNPTPKMKTFESGGQNSAITRGDCRPNIRPFPECATCGLHSLKLCRGAVFED